MPLYYVRDIDTYVLIENGRDMWFVDYHDAIQSTGILTITPINRDQIPALMEESTKNDD